jgi:hypothetical protein
LVALASEIAAHTLNRSDPVAAPMTIIRLTMDLLRDMISADI